jgi:hypothetical protein
MQMPKRRGSRNYSLVEQLRLVVEIDNVLPVDTADWKQVGARFNAHETLGKPARSVVSLQRKFASIWRTGERTHRSNRAPLHKLACEVKCRLDDRAGRRREQLERAVAQRVVSDSARRESVGDRARQRSSVGDGKRHAAGNLRLDEHSVTANSCEPEAMLPPNAATAPAEGVYASLHSAGDDQQELNRTQSSCARSTMDFHALIHQLLRKLEDVHQLESDVRLRLSKIKLLPAC